MSTKIFIDGEAGTTGLQIRERLSARNDISLIQLDDANRKDANARKDALGAADIAILCLPDAAAKEAVALAQSLDTRIIDASSAHRVAKDWTYGFPEMAPDQPHKIANAKRVTNPGCYPHGYIAAIRPLIDAGLMPTDFAATYNAISGYSGGGKSLIADYEAAGDKAPAYAPYGLQLDHKHLPEMQAYAGLGHQPIFQPAVGNYAQGMIGAVPLPLWSLPGNLTGQDIQACLAARYADSNFVSVAPLADFQKSKDVEPEVFNNTNNLRIYVFANDASQNALVLSVYDNLGKGASGAAVQNLNLMMGVDETTGLV
jgi:N-acetyl-gamma-glutamyl-phosphate reductase